MLAMPKVGVLQGQTKAPPEEYLGPNCRYGPPNWYVFRIIDKPTAQFEACNIFYRREVFEETGGFDENLGWWGEDTAAGWRVLEAGWERAFAEDVIVVHPVEPRGWRWYMKNGLLERNNIRLAAEHPGFRNEGFWRPWAVRREDLAFLIGIVGVLGALRFRPALLLALPYIWWQRPSIRKASFFRLCYQIPALDAARALGHWQGSIENRIFVI
jgi:GT2 family glycosyltransferase